MLRIVLSRLKILLIGFMVCQSAFAWSSQACVVSAEYRASNVGATILKAGGNAVDAAVAMAFALAVVHPGCGNLGGGGFALIHMNDNFFALDFREDSPEKLKVSDWRQASKKRKVFLSTAVPGTVAGLMAMHQRFGQLSLHQDMQAAIQLAYKGFPLVAGDLFFIQQGLKHTEFSSEAKKIFSDHGDPLEAGDYLYQPALAKTLRTISNQGGAAFYHGRIADDLLAYVHKYGGLITKKDLEHYRVHWFKPLTCFYRGYEIITMPPPSQGGYVICRSLNLLKDRPLAKYKPLSQQPVTSMVKAMRQSFKEAKQFLGDPDQMQVSAQRLISDPQARKMMRTPKVRIQTNEGLHTTSLVVVDQAGNAVSLTYSLNHFFGNGQMPPKLGFFLNNTIKDFNFNDQALPNSYHPDHTPMSSIAPTMIMKGKQLSIIMGTPGGSTIPTQLIELITSVVDHHLSLKQALNLPRFHAKGQAVCLEKHAKEKVKKRFASWFPKLEFGLPFGFDAWGGAVVIQRDGKNGWKGAVDPRRPAGSVAKL